MFEVCERRIRKESSVELLRLRSRVFKGSRSVWELGFAKALGIKVSPLGIWSFHWKLSEAREGQEGNLLQGFPLRD